ncbi:MAG TPA: hypothetical protein VGX68_02550 [Thermoanaerobaculia bacterium]|jgi:hypothetical protein|nr:hypothetical protein [Thermoanaerobaculia bacterium]
MKPWILLLPALLVIPAGSRAAEPPVRIALRAPSAPLEPGKAARIVVELLGESGRPAAALEAVPVKLAGIASLATAARVIVPAGASRIEVPIRAPKAGLWQIEASSKGLFSGFGVVVCLSKTQRTVPGKRETRALRLPVRRPAQEGASPAPPQPPPPQPPPPPPPEEAEVLDETPRTMPIATSREPAEAASSGRLELIAHPTRVPRTRDGWQSVVDAFWFEEDVPALRSSPLDGFLVLEGGNSVMASSERIRIPSGQFKAEAPARISARSADSTSVQALYLGGKSRPVRIDFVSPPPAQLALAGASRSFRGLTGVTSDILVRLLDDGGEPAAADREIPVEIAVEGPLGTRSYQAKVPAGAIHTTVSLELNRPGSYSTQASAPGLKASDPMEVRFALDWLLIACSLLGGVLGSLTRMLYRRERVWPKGFIRTFALGVAAALFVLLLSVFGVLSVLGEALPAAKTLEKVPATSLLGALLLGFIAGLVFDKIFGRFLGSRGGRRAKPSTPAPKEAPA